MSITGISLEHFSDTDQSTSHLSLHSLIHNATFHSFLSNKIKQYAATTYEHIKWIIDLLNQFNIIATNASTIWENTDGCVEH